MFRRRMKCSSKHFFLVNTFFVDKELNAEKQTAHATTTCVAMFATPQVLLPISR